MRLIEASYVAGQCGMGQAGSSAAEGGKSNLIVTLYTLDGTPSGDPCGFTIENRLRQYLVVDDNGNFADTSVAHWSEQMLRCASTICLEAD